MTYLISAAVLVALILTLDNAFSSILKKAGQVRVLSCLLTALISTWAYSQEILRGSPAENLVENAKPVLNYLTFIVAISYGLIMGASFPKELSNALKQSALKGGRILSIGLGNFAVPFVIAILLMTLIPSRQMRGVDEPVQFVFLALLMSATALPVLAAALKDVNFTASSHLSGVAITLSLVTDAAVWTTLTIILMTTSSAGLDLTSLGIGLSLSGLAYLLARASKKLRWKTKILIVSSRCIAIGTFADALSLEPFVLAFLLGIATSSLVNLNTLTSVIERYVCRPLLPIYCCSMLWLIKPIEPGVNTDAIAVVGLVAVLTRAGYAKYFGSKIGLVPSDSTKLAFLLNARGVMEVILLNIGIKHNLITPNIYFTILVGSVLVTIISCFNPTRRREKPVNAAVLASSYER